MKTIGTLMLFATLSMGCLRSDPVGRFAPDAFYPTRDHYRVRYSYGTGPDALLPRGWRVANFDVDGTTHAARSRPDSLVGFQVTAGRRSRVLTGARYDLHFQHQDGEMFARTVPLSPMAAGDSLPQSMHNAMSPFMGPNGPNVLGRAWGTDEQWLVDEGWARVDGRPAYFITFDLVPRNTRVAAERATIVALTAGQVWRQRRARVPTLLVFGYVTTPSRHDAHRSAFQSFVSRVDVR